MRRSWKALEEVLEVLEWMSNEDKEKGLEEILKTRKSRGGPEDKQGGL